MSTPYTGNPSNVSDFLVTTINGATNAAPIVIQTTTPHGFSTGDLVSVIGVQGNVAANSPTNQPWTITVIDATHFSLNGSQGSGAYTSGGQAADLSLTPSSSTASGADPILTMNVGIQSALDRTQYIAQSPASFSLVGQYVSQFASLAVGPVAGTGTWGAMPPASFSPSTTPTSFAAGPTFLGDLVTWQVGDTVDVSMTLTAHHDDTTAQYYMAIGLYDDLNLAVNMPGSDQARLTVGIAGGRDSFCLRGWAQNQNQGSGASINVTGPTVTVTGLSPANFTGQNVGNYIRLLGSFNPANNGTFLILSAPSSSSVTILNPNALTDSTADITWGLYNSRFNFSPWGKSFTSDNIYLTDTLQIIVNHYRPTRDIMITEQY
jgi:hypothetical protein